MHSINQAILEALEPRTYLTTLYWHASSGTWDSADLNWNTAYDGSGTQVAWTDGDDAVFGSGTATVTIDDTVNANSLTVSGPGYTITGGTLNLAAASSISAALIISGVNLTNNGTLTWSGGNVTINDSSQITNGGTLTLDGGSDTFNLDSNYIDNGSDGGTISWAGGTLDFDGTNLFGGTINFDGGSNSLSISDGTFTYGYITWTSGDATITSLDQSNNSLTLDGGSNSWNMDGDITIYESSTMTWLSGDIELGATLNNEGTLTLDGGSNTFTMEGSAVIYSDGSLTWSSGDITFENSSFTTLGPTELDGGDNSLIFDNTSITMTGSSASLEWDSGNILLTDGSTLGCYSGASLILNGDAQSFAFDGSSLDDDGSANISWTSGNISFAEGSTITLSTDPLDVPSASTLTLDDPTLLSNFTNDGTIAFVGDSVDLSGLTLSGGAYEIDGTATNTGGLTIDGGTTLTINGTLNWDTTDNSQLANITNDGVIAFDSGTNPDLIGLSGDSTATEGSTYTLTLGSVSGDISDSVDSYVVDWGDGIGYDTYTNTGAVTYTYGGSPTASTDYTITVHLITDYGAYIAAATKDITVNNAIQAPTDLTTTAEGFDGIHLSWTDNSTDAAAYQVEVEYADTDNFTLVTTLAAHSTSYQYDDMPTEDMTFRVRAVGNGESAYSSAVTCDADTSFMNQGDATDLTISYSSSGATLAWDQDSESTTEYYVAFRKIGSDPGDHVWTSMGVDVGASDATAGDIFLPWSELAWPDGVQVALISVDNSSATNYVVAQVPQNITAPELTITPAYDSSLTEATVVNGYNEYSFSWTSSGSADYQVTEVSQGVSEAGYAYATFVSTGDTTGYVAFDGGQPSGVFDILATNATGASISNVVDLAKTSTPTDFAVEALGTGAVGLTWDNNSLNESGTVVERSSDGGSTWTTVETTSADTTSWIDTSVTPGTDYEYKIQHTRDVGSGSLDSDFTEADGPVATPLAAPKYTIVVDGPITVAHGGSSSTVKFHIIDSTTGETVTDQTPAISGTPAGLTAGLSAGTVDTQGNYTLTVTTTTATSGTETVIGLKVDGAGEDGSNRFVNVTVN